MFFRCQVVLFCLSVGKLVVLSDFQNEKPTQASLIVCQNATSQINCYLNTTDPSEELFGVVVHLKFLNETQHYELSFMKDAIVQGHNITIDDLLPSTKYEIKFFTVDKDRGESEWSKPQTVMTSTVVKQKSFWKSAVSIVEGFFPFIKV